MTFLGNLALFGEAPSLLCLAFLKAPRSANIGASQIRQGIAANSKGTAFVVYEDVYDAKQACDKLNGFNFQNRYLVGQYNPCPPTEAPRPVASH